MMHVLNEAKFLRNKPGPSGGIKIIDSQKYFLPLLVQKCNQLLGCISWSNKARHTKILAPPKLWSHNSK